MAGESMTLSALQEKIAKRAWEDPAFEAEFMADPKATFEKYTGRKIPDDLKIFAHYNTPNEIHFVIPRRPETTGDELTDEDLERVAGGETILGLTAVTAWVSAAAYSAFQNTPSETW